MVFSKLMRAFSGDLGVDLGSGNTRVCARGRGVVVDEPSVVAVKRNTQQILPRDWAIGRSAKDMIGRTPQSIDAIRPVREGVITDFDTAEAMLAHFLRKASTTRRWIGPRVVVAVPFGINPVAKRAMLNAAERAGARKVYMIEQPRAAGLGAGVPIHEARAHMIVDVGAGTTDIAVLSLADVVVFESLKVAGEAMDAAVIDYLRKHYNILLGTNPAEELKIRLGSVCPQEGDVTTLVPGRDLIAGRPRSIEVNSEDVREALAEPIQDILHGIRRTLERTGPELSGDLMETGITLCGGGVLLDGLPGLIEAESGLPVRLAEEPRSAVIRGLDIILEDLETFLEILESTDDDL